MKKFIVTSALPYANGPLHIGHFLEYIQADVFARFLRLSDNEVVFLCGDDAHGSPIEIAARKEKKSPETFVAEIRETRLRDFKDFHISFDVYHSTHSQENQELVNIFFSNLKKYFFLKDIEQLFDEQEKRFLPDRYVKGTCPHCKARDQYGDNCEACGAVYKSTELIEPYSTLNGKKPVLRTTKNYFFRLSDFSSKLETWLTNNESLQSEMRNSFLEWIKKGLQDWDVTRDAPYFGFLIPGTPNKYLYVWFDAPIGYIASLAKLRGSVETAVKEWNQQDTTRIQFVGKDVSYHHFLFWPAMLDGAGFQLPTTLRSHGFITVNKEKMSKSRGTFITAQAYLKSQPAEFLRFFYASTLGAAVQDVDISEQDFKERINSGLVDNIANFIYRVTSFAEKHFQRKLSKINEDEEVISNLQQKYVDVKEAYTHINLKEAMRIILEISSFGNKYFQDNTPWTLVKTDKKRCQQVVTFAASVAFSLSVLLEPVLPEFSKKIQKQFGITGGMKKVGLQLENVSLNAPRIIFTKIEDKALPIPDKALFPLNLQVAEIQQAKEHPDADKLLVLQVNIGKEERQIVAGLRGHYTPEELVGKKVVVVANLKSAKLRGQVSQGMVLAAADGDKLLILEPDANSGTSVTPENMQVDKKTISFEQFNECSLQMREKCLFFNEFPLVVNKKRVILDVPDGTIVR